MKDITKASPSFTYVEVELDPGERLICESDAMLSMDSDIQIGKALNGNIFEALIKKFFVGETIFLTSFTNTAASPKKVVISQKYVGDIRKIELDNNIIFFERGSYICSTEDVDLDVRWAGFKSWIFGEGLFKLRAEGKGSIWLGAYGHIYEKEVDGEYLVDNGHLLSFEPGLDYSLQLSGGLIQSVSSGEGLLARFKGKGKLLLQSRNYGALVKFLRRKV